MLLVGGAMHEMIFATRCRAGAQQQLHGSAASTAPIGSLLWSLFSLQLFFCTGHFCEFAGLQYTAGGRSYENLNNKLTVAPNGRAHNTGQPIGVSVPEP